MAEMSQHQRNVQQVLEGNERVWFHPFEDKLAVWHGGPQVLIVSSRTWDQLDVFNVRAFDKSLSEVEDAVVCNLARRGFDRSGRTQDDTRVVEA